MYSEELLLVLRYFDYFNYPLRKKQLHTFLSAKVDSMQILEHSIDGLVAQQIIEEKDGFYALKNCEQLVSNRLEGEERYKALSARIEKTTSRLHRFPFITFIGLSGSLSKGYAAENADIDLFIVTKKNRLWICRTILHLFKKISFLKGSQHWYCMNYLVDETALAIEEQNYFTAIELASLKPLADQDRVHQNLIESNIHWMSTVLPNYHYSPNEDTEKIGVFWPFKVFELFGTDSINKFLMQWTDKKWRRKWARKKFPAEDYELAFKTRINVSKNHRHNYQKKLLELLK